MSRITSIILTLFSLLHFTTATAWIYYSGPASSFPAITTWKDFPTLFSLNSVEMLQTPNTATDISRIRTGILEAAKLGVDSRVLMCMIMQESSGDVGVITPTNIDGLGTGGLMQCEGSPQFPEQHGLSQAQISSMILAGTNHFKLNLASVSGQGTASGYYQALRLYNSGSMNIDNLSDGRGSTNSYVSDIANCLQGLTN